ncbi:MAG: DUF2141 domain-containing protein [Gammaproteobacteria bacterium]|nr:DUF2141 domain-containing protein [Gammaproteobacteria bacterium]
MKIKSLVMIILSIGVSFSSLSYAERGELYSLTVSVDGLRNSKGVVQFALYNKDDSIPDEEYKKYYEKEISSISNGSSSITFNNLPKGLYAVNILHDENMNGEIDKGFILPIEGIGFSNYESIGLTNRPDFTKASFSLTSDIKKNIKVIYL